MILNALDALVEATRSKRVRWRKVDPEKYETVGKLKASIEFHYPQVGGETTTGADIIVVSIGGVMTSFFSESEGALRVRAILRAAFPEWERHLSDIEGKIDDFVRKIPKVQPRAAKVLRR